MGTELAQQSADAGREPGGTAEAIAARGGDPAIAAFIGGSDSIRGAMSDSKSAEPASSPAQDADGGLEADVKAAGAEVDGAERDSAADSGDPGTPSPTPQRRDPLFISWHAMGPETLQWQSSLSQMPCQNHP